MKRVGIVTMHKVVNYGSALQAWATQEVIRRLGYDVLIIDYVYPNAFLYLLESLIRIALNIFRPH
jgi:hypothetical protein